MLDISDEIMETEWFLGDKIRDFSVCVYFGKDKDICTIFSCNTNIPQEIRIKLHQRIIDLHNNEIRSKKQ